MRWPSPCSSNDHWSAASSRVSGCSAEKIRPNPDRNERSLVRRAASGPSRLRMSFCPGVRLAFSITMLPLNSSTPARANGSCPSTSRASSSVATEVPIS